MNNAVSLLLVEVVMLNDIRLQVYILASQAWLYGKFDIRLFVICFAPRTISVIKNQHKFEGLYCYF